MKFTNRAMLLTILYQVIIFSIRCVEGAFVMTTDICMVVPVTIMGNNMKRLTKVG